MPIKHLRSVACVAILFIAISQPSSASGLVLNGERFSPRVSIGDIPLAIRGSATFRYLLWTLYSAVLYVPPNTPFSAALEDVPRHLEIAYHRSIERARFVEAAEAVLARSLDQRALEKVQGRVDLLHEKYTDVVDGDRYVLRYAPGSGTTLAFNGAPLVTVPGSDFAKAYFGIWLGDGALDANLQAALLGTESASN